jgi:hypothetical protein
VVNGYLVAVYSSKPSWPPSCRNGVLALEELERALAARTTRGSRGR